MKSYISKIIAYASLTAGGIIWFVNVNSRVPCIDTSTHLWLHFQSELVRAGQSDQISLSLTVLSGLRVLKQHEGCIYLCERCDRGHGTQIGSWSIGSR